MNEKDNKLKVISDKLDSIMKSQEAVQSELKDVFINFHVLKHELETKAAEQAKLELEAEKEFTESFTKYIEIEEAPIEPIQSEITEPVIEAITEKVIASEVNDSIKKEIPAEESKVTPDESSQKAKEAEPKFQPNPEIPKDKSYYKQTTFSNIYTKDENDLKPKTKIDLEKYIGENLINKIGIAITVIGVAIGAKYSIDNNIINPLVRIILGYLMGAALLLVGIRTKEKYENYSAVLTSGSIAILYFITYFAYSFYSLIPFYVAFPLMLVFTAFTILAAINYNKQIIGLIGIVGAYAIPFLLSTNSGNVMALFSYISILNIGILIIAYKRYWKQLYYSSFIFTWLIYAVWFGQRYNADHFFGLAFCFNFIFFATFYVILMLFKVQHNDKVSNSESTFTNMILLLNISMFFGFGYNILDSHRIGEHYLGIFTLVNAIIHFVNVIYIHKKGLADKSFNYLIAGLVILFITIAVPIQLKGNWISMIWALEAALLFWFGRTRNIKVSENLSYIVMALASFLLMKDWTIFHDYGKEGFTPILNKDFMGKAVYLIAFGFIAFINKKEEFKTTIEMEFKDLRRLFEFTLHSVLFGVTYFALFNEIAFYFDGAYYMTAINTINDKIYNENLGVFKNLWLINYTIVFTIMLNYLNLTKLKSPKLVKFNVFASIFCLILFLTIGLWQTGDLLFAYLHPANAKYFPANVFYVAIRYISFALVALLIYSLKKLVTSDFIEKKPKNTYVFMEFLMYITLGWILSNEVIHWMTIAGSEQAFKLGLSIFWGSYSSVLIVVGIWKNKQHLRVGAITLFALTLVKLFLMDISDMPTIFKTIVFVVLGILLLIISFLYNKYKHLITGENEKLS